MVNEWNVICPALSCQKDHKLCKFLLPQIYLFSFSPSFVLLYNFLYLLWPHTHSELKTTLALK